MRPLYGMDRDLGSELLDHRWAQAFLEALGLVSCPSRILCCSVAHVGPLLAAVWKCANKHELQYCWENSFHGALSALVCFFSPTGQSESVRDVQFSIRDYFTFAATFENGNVQLWDIRRPDRYERMFTAHNGPVFCCDWHPEDR